MTASAPLDYDGFRSSPSQVPPSREPRLLAGVIIVIAQWLLIKIPAWAAPGTSIHFMAMMVGPLVGLLAVIVWWIFFSRLAWNTRWAGLAAFFVGAFVAFAAGHPTMKMALVMLATPVVTTLWGVWPLIGRRFGDKPLRVGLVALLLATWGLFATLRMDGLDGSINAAFAWRWSPTAEDRYLASRTIASGEKAIPVTALNPSPALLTLSTGDWPAFRGPMRDGRVAGTSIPTDWAQHPPRKLWSHLIGPGWSSFCAVGNRVFTQEQRGPSEAVVCYAAATGDELWAHDDAVRFEESMAGPGPRATPTFDGGRLYAFGAKGRLNCLDPVTGRVIWSRDVAAESGAPLPMWGFSSSPLVTGGLVAVITGAKGKAIATYHADTGLPAWSTGSGFSYASLQLSRVDGVEQMLFVTEGGLAGLDPLAGTVLWQDPFKMPPNANRVIQPALVGETDLLLGAAFGVGTQRVRVTHNTDSTWKTQEIWNTRSIKPYYNDMVVHKGNLYGFDGSTFVCINLDTGKPRWRSPVSYGNGQVLLLADQDLLLILSEHGELALVEAKPDAHHELARFQAIEGKTWNHPVLAHGNLFVRNGEAIACYQVE